MAYTAMKMRRFPPGFRFLPTDAELLDYYLKRRNSGFLFPNVPIYDCYIYDFSPDDLACMYGMGENQEMYFFTEREPVTACASRPNRTAAGGFWRSNRSYEVRDKEDRLIGFRMSLKFFKSKKEPSNWLMDEYKLLEGDEAMATHRESKRRKVSGNQIFNHRLKAQSKSKHAHMIYALEQEIHTEKMGGFVLCRIHRRGNCEEANSSIQSTYPFEVNNNDSRMTQIQAASEVSKAAQSNDPIVIDLEGLLNLPQDSQEPQSDDIVIDLEELLSPPEDSQAPQSDDIVIDLEELLNPPENSKAPQAHDSGADIEELLSPPADSNAPQYDDFDAYAEIDIEELLNLMN